MVQRRTWCKPESSGTPKALRQLAAVGRTPRAFSTRASNKMPTKGQAGGTSLTVAQYSQLVLRKYIGRQFSSDAQENLAIAAEELYVILKRVRGASSKDSEDCKAPLKAIRNTIDHFAFHGTRGADSEEVDALMQLYAALEECCQQRLNAAGGSEDREAALQVQDALRYRMTRLVTGDAWDTRPLLKVRVLKLMFGFSARDNMRLLSGSRGLGIEGVERRVGVPRQSRQAGNGGEQRVEQSSCSEAASRQESHPHIFGRRGSGAAAAAAAAAGPLNRWGDAINELGKMPGPRMLPLLKLAMLENLELSQAAGSAATAPPPAEPTPPTSAAASEHVSAVPPPAGPSPAASEGAGSTNSGGGPVAARVAPAAPSTPAQRPGPSRVVQAGQAEGKPPVSGVDDLLGLFDEPAPQRLQGARAQPSPTASSSSPGLPAEQVFGAFGSTAPGEGASNPFVASSPFLASTPAVMQHPVARAGQPVHQGPQAVPPDYAAGQLASLSISGPPPVVQPPAATPVWQYSPALPPQQYDQGQGAFSAPSTGQGPGSWAFSQGGPGASPQVRRSSEELFRHNSNPQPFGQPSGQPFD
ncbi:hypothetical protein D9Q98_007990 [Chlorella vulgaris]|uniref:Uncharacterized protein n=1 Tax=Chlorella vulgaris TaxID=3077 RepID=A0A9D4THZ4_CHLVU|nr:hypothetical protein D9Q98_007990 [Chlorella vulgaris]